MSERGKLRGKIALVTGSTSGIGEGIARLLVSEGASVMITGRDEGNGFDLIEEIGAADVPERRLAFCAADLTRAAECRSLVEETARTFGGLDVLVNNAGDFSRGSLEDTTVEQWDRQMALNLRAPFVLAQAAVPLMRDRGGGSIVNIGSINAYVGLPNLTAYSTSKGGLMTFTKNAARQLNEDRIRVNLINVGWTFTPGEDRIVRQETGREDWLEEATRSRPFGRLLLPRDIALATLYFASEDGALVTGSVLDLEQYPVGVSEAQV